MSKYDIVIIGGGLGGLSTANILAKEGYNICVLDSHHIIGGCLQSFKRKGLNINTGIHYVGSLSEGQTTHQYFKYLGIIDKLHLHKLDENGFDIIRFNNGEEYRYKMGMEAFAQELKRNFPNEQQAIDNYTELLTKIGTAVSPEVLRTGQITLGGKEYMSQSIYKTLEDLTSNQRLQQVLAATNPLYGGDRAKSSVYTHSMVNYSNIEGAYSFVGGTQHIADELVRSIEALGGTIRSRSEVTGIYLKDYDIEYLEINNKERIYADHVISAIHPANTYKLFKNNTVLKKINFSRIYSLENTYGIYTLYILPKTNTIKYSNCNFYLYKNDDVWNIYRDYKGCNIPSMLVSMQTPEEGEYAQVISVMLAMPYELVAKWSDTTIERRGEEYKEFKERYNAYILEHLYKHFPELKGNIANIYSSSPLSYRDYTQTPEGSAYGIIKDCRNPVSSYLPVRGKIRNLYLTGQNINVHGCLGVLISSAVTAGQFVGLEYLTRKIGNV